MRLAELPLGRMQSLKELRVCLLIGNHLDQRAENVSQTEQVRNFSRNGQPEKYRNIYSCRPSPSQYWWLSVYSKYCKDKTMVKAWKRIGQFLGNTVVCLVSRHSHDVLTADRLHFNCTYSVPCCLKLMIQKVAKGSQSDTLENVCNILVH